MTSSLASVQALCGSRGRHPWRRHAPLPLHSPPTPLHLLLPFPRTALVPCCSPSAPQMPLAPAPPLPLLLENERLVPEGGGAQRGAGTGTPATLRCAAARRTTAAGHGSSPAAGTKPAPPTPPHPTPPSGPPPTGRAAVMRSSSMRRLPAPLMPAAPHRLCPPPLLCCTSMRAPCPPLRSLFQARRSATPPRITVCKPLRAQGRPSSSVVPLRRQHRERRAGRNLLQHHRQAGRMLHLPPLQLHQHHLADLWGRGGGGLSGSESVPTAGLAACAGRHNRAGRVKRPRGAGRGARRPGPHAPLCSSPCPRSRRL